MKLNRNRIETYLSEHVGESTTSWMLVNETGAYDGDMSRLNDKDLFEMDEEVRDIARANGYRLDSSAYRDMIVGLPWNIEFVIRKKRNHLVYHYSSMGSYIPSIYEIKVYDREINNVRIIENILLDPTANRDCKFTLNIKKMNRIKETIENSGVLNIKRLEKPEVLVMDGTTESVYFSNGVKTKSFTVDNLFMTYDGYSKDTNAGLLIKTINRINKIIDPEY